MNATIQSVRFDLDQKLENFIHDKLGKLERFIENAIGADVILKLDKDNENGNKVATITISVPGKNYVAECRAKSFEEAVDLSIDAIKKQNEKQKVKSSH